MAKRASSHGDVSKESARPSASRTQKSSILKSAFAPSAYQLSLFASVIQAFDSQRLRLHDFSNGRLHCDQGLGAGMKINSLDWGYYGPDFRDQYGQKPKKKRKRHNDSHEFITANAKNAVVAMGTNASDVQMFSPAEGKVVGKLNGFHERGVSSFRFVQGDCLWGWSIGGDGKMAQWDLKSNKAVRTISVPDASVTLLGPPTHEQPQVLCASSAPYALTFASSTDIELAGPSTTITFDSFKQPVQNLFRSGKDKLHNDESFLAVDSDRYINVFDIPRKRLVRTLIASSGVRALSFHDHVHDEVRSLPDQQLVAVTQTGLAEIFSCPFVGPSESDLGQSVRAKRKNMTRKANATVQITRPGSTGSSIPIFDASFQGLDLVFAWAEGGVELSFERIKWRDEHNPRLLFSGSKEIVATKKMSAFTSGLAQGGNDLRNSHVDESHAVIANVSAAESNSQEAAIALSSDEAYEADVMDEDSVSESEDAPEEEEEEEDEEEAEEEEDSPSAVPAVLLNGLHESPLGDSNEAAQPTTAGEVEEDASNVEPSFGDLLAARSADPISIADTLPSLEPGALVPVEASNPIAIPSGISLSTVLTQALRTNDNNLLESCFHNTDTQTIRSTIQRIDSSLAGNLIQKLAERLSSRPGRYGHLLVWVQWICVAHGGAIGGQPDVLRKVKTLYKVLNQRSKALESLLLLKGKLDMLDAQLSLRKQLVIDRGPVRNPDEGHLIYVEGEEDNDSSAEDGDAGDAGDTNMTSPQNSRGKEKKNLQDLVPDSEGQSEDNGDMPMTNGIVAVSDSSDYDSEENEGSPGLQREGGLVDDEAEESDEDSHPSDREDDVSEEEDVDDDDDEEDSEMDDFIDDGPVEQAESASEISLDETPEKPPTKKHRHH